MTKHTQGPWRVEAKNYPIADTGDYDGCLQILSANAKRPIVEIWEDGDEPEANARLMAAAPELLEALEWCAETMAVFVEDGSAAPDSVMGKNLTTARAAIAKATGETV